MLRNLFPALGLLAACLLCARGQSQYTTAAGGPIGDQNYGSTSRFGVVKCDGTTITCPGGVLSNPGNTLAQPTPLTGQAANVNSTPFYTAGSSAYYQVCTEEVLTQAATTSSTLPFVYVAYTSAVDDVTKSVSLNNTFAGSTANATYASNASCALIYVHSGSTLAYYTLGYASSGATAMQFSLGAIVMGPYSGSGTATCGISTTSLTAGMVSSAYSQQLAESNCSGTWSVSSGTLPSGLSLSTSGLISGTPTASGTSTFTVAVGTATQSLTLTINASSACSISTTSLSAGTVSSAYSQQLAEANCSGNWSVSSGTLPAGITLSTSGLLSGTPTASGTSTFTVAVGTATQSLTLTINAASTDEAEFVGPFASWGNVQTAYGATGNGSTDDTNAIQAGINAVEAGTIPVLYFPAGTYKISSTLTITGNRYIAMVGADPTTTTIKWAGGTGCNTTTFTCDMIYINGAAYSRIQRLTLDGSSLAETAINQGWDGTTTNGKDAGEGNGYTDLVIKNIQYGFRGGTVYACYGSGQSSKSCDDADTEILRVHFSTCTVACVSIESWNSLNWQIFDSEFTNAAIGVTNTFGAGMYYVYNSVFYNSSVADLEVNAYGVFSVRGCTSVGSAKFLIADPNNDFVAYTLQDNQIITPTSSRAIDFETIGPLVMLDNKVQSASGATAPIVYQSTTGTNTPAITSINDVWTVSNPISINGTTTKTITYLDSVNPSLSLTAPSLPAFAPNYNRTVIDVAAGSSAATIQTAINNAATANNNTVVHLMPGSYTITSTLSIPANTKLQLWGDSRNTTLTCSGITTAITLNGPSQAQMGDFTIYCPSETAIAVTNADQSGARVFADQMLGSGPATTLSATNLAYTWVFLRMEQSYMAAASSDIIANGGGTNGGHITIVGGTSSNSSTSAVDMYHVENGGKIIAMDKWYEGDTPTISNETSASGTITFSGMQLTPYTTQDSIAGSMIFSGFSGSASFVNDITQNHWSIIQNSAMDLMILGVSQETGGLSWPAPTGSGGDTRVFESAIGANAWTSVTDIGTPDQTYMVNMLSQLRSETPMMGLPSVPSGATDVRLFRIGLTSPAVGLSVSH